MPSISELYDKNVSKEFYEDRYSQDYMDEWPQWKKERVAGVIRELNLPPTGEALDFGCGAGVYTEVLRQTLPDWKVYGTDFSASALVTARHKYPQCTFLDAGQETPPGKFDFILTHHVLEHVFDLDAAVSDLNRMLKPEAGMLHILPCGNEGSLEHEICRLRVDGIDPQLGNRFFFEDEGHVRRLTTEQLAAKLQPDGFELVKEFYANQYYGALDWISLDGREFIEKLCDPTRARDETGGKKLKRLRRKLLRIVEMRELETRIETARAWPGKTWKGRLKMLPALPALAVIKKHNRYFARKTDTEWSEMKTRRNGSEMYLYFARRGKV